MPKFPQFVILSLLFGGSAIGHSLRSGAISNHLNEDQSAQNKSWTSIPSEQFLEASSIFRERRNTRRRDFPPAAHPPRSLDERGEFAHDRRAPQAAQDATRPDARYARSEQAATRVVKPSSDFHDIIGAHRRRMSRHFVDGSDLVPVLNPSRTSGPSLSSPQSVTATGAATAAMVTGSLYPATAYESHKVHTTSYSDHSFLPRKFTRRKLHTVVGATFTESSSTDTALKREQDQLRTVDGQEGSEQLRQHRTEKNFEGDRASLLSHIEDSGDGNIVQRENGQDSYTTVRPISAEVLNTDQSSFIPDFEGFSDMFFPSIRSPQVFQIDTEDFARAVPVIASQRNREKLKQDCSMLLDSGYLPTGPETFAGEWSASFELLSKWVGLASQRHLFPRQQITVESSASPDTHSADFCSNPAESLKLI